MEIKIKKKLNEGKNGAAELLTRSKDKVVQVMDQNGDGHLGLSDITTAADSVGGALKRGGQSVAEKVSDQQRQIDLKTLQPVFPEMLTRPDFPMTKLICIRTRDKRYAQREACIGSIGCFTDQKGLRILNLFFDSVDAFGLSFYPNQGSEYYLADPTDSRHYIAVDQYFYYLKLQRINELQRIAQELGAKHFRLTFMEEQAAFAAQKRSSTASAKITLPKVKAAHAEEEYEQSSTKKSYSRVEIAAEMEFPGQAPVQPTLRYMHRDPNVQNLIAMRLNATSPLQRQTLMLKMSNSIGITTNEAAKIDAAMKGAKFTGHGSISSEVSNEAHRYLEYEIDF